MLKKKKSKAHKANHYAKKLAGTFFLVLSTPSTTTSTIPGLKSRNHEKKKRKYKKEVKNTSLTGIYREATCTTRMGCTVCEALNRKSTSSSLSLKKKAVDESMGEEKRVSNRKKNACLSVSYNKLKEEEDLIYRYLDVDHKAFWWCCWISSCSL